MRGLSSITALAFCWSAARAIYTDEAFKSDFHHALLGQPLPSTTFHAPHAASKATLIYTITDRGVVAAVNPKDGAVVWRHILRDIPFTASPLLRIVDNQSVVITGLTDHLQAWNIADGKAVWSSQFPSESLQDLQVLQPSEAGSAQTKRDILALYDGVTPSVRRINAKDGSIIWQYNGKRYGMLPATA